MTSAWQTMKLGDVCRVIGGGTPSKNRADYYSGNIPWATVRDMRKEIITETEWKITKQAIKDSATNVIPQGNVVIATRVGLGKVCLLGQDTAINQDLRGIIPIDVKCLAVRFLFWWLKSIAHLIEQEGIGATVKGVKLPFVKSLEVPMPPIAEQKRIVGILDEAFEGIAKAKVNAEKNLQNARALFEGYLGAVFKQPGNGWERRSLVSLCSLFVDSAHRTPEYQEEGIPALRPRDVANGELNLLDVARVSEPEYEIQSKRHKPAPGDIVYSRELSYGWAAQLPKSPRVCLSQGMCIFRVSPQIDPVFLLHVLNGPVGREQAGRAAVGAAHPHINLGDIKSYLIPLPPIDMQKQVSQEINALKAEARRLESIYQQKLAALEELKKSLLHQAFTGAL